MFNILVQAIGKTTLDPLVMAIQTQMVDLMAEIFKENKLVYSQQEGLTLTFNGADILSKIEMIAPKSAYRQCAQQWCDPSIWPINKKEMIRVLGEPTAKMRYPFFRGEREQFLYNKEQYWLSLKFKEDQLEAIVLLLPDLISEAIKKGFVPIRTCRSRK